MSTTTVRTYTDFGALPPAAWALLEESGRRDFFHGAHWFRIFNETMLESGAARIYSVEDAPGRPVLLLMARTPAGQNGSMLRCRPAKRSLASLTNYQSDTFLPIVAAHIGDGAPLFRELVACLSAERPRWTLLDFNYLDPRSPAYRWLLDALRAGGLHVTPYLHCNQWYEDTTGLSFKSYMERRSPSAHKTIQNYARKARKLERTSRVRYEIHAGPDIDGPLADYQRVYDASWKESEPFPAFVPELLRMAAAMGTLRLGILYIDDEPAATEVAIVSGSKATMVKTAYDTKFRDVSAGSLIIMRVMQHLLDVDQVREVGFGAFDAPYKAVWVSGSRPLVGLLALNLKTLGGLRCGLEYLARTVARELRQRLKARPHA